MRKPRSSLQGAFTALVALSVARCGAKSELLPAEEPCAVLGQERACADPCGVGVQRCADGVWQSCLVPSTTRACENSCGSGTQRCEAGRWLECDVAPSTRRCENVCGAGTQTCRAGAWKNCEVPRTSVACSSVCGDGEEICEDGAWKRCNAPQPRPPVLYSIVRDFNDSHPDFELPLLGDHLETGLVQFELGPDDKPVYANRAGSVTTSGAGNFDQWFRDLPGINQAVQIDLNLEHSTESPGFFRYRDDTFFPIDGRLFGNQNRTHNYHFTLETSTRFEYRGGEIFRFDGDDDMWVFINRRLAIDLGGIHRSLTATVNLDEAASKLGLVRGQSYPLHFFFAERHTVESHFAIDTSISEPGSCD
jgi:fibro-slime domain-containing protein